MSKSEITVVPLGMLAEGIPALPGDFPLGYIQKIVVCFCNNCHDSGVILNVNFNGKKERIQLVWECDVTRQMVRAHADTVELAEDAACGIAFLLVEVLTEYTTVEKSIRGTRFDYFLSKKSRNDDLLFNDLDASLEVSGIYKESDQNSVDKRVKQKENRYKKDGYEAGPLHICVVEFSKPSSRLKVV